MDAEPMITRVINRFGVACVAGRAKIYAAVS